MNGTTVRVLRLAVSAAGLVALGWVLTSAAARPGGHRMGLPTDWSHQHLIFTKPGSEEIARLVSEDPRYWQQIFRRTQALRLPEAAANARGLFEFPAADGGSTQGAWSWDLGTNASAGAGNYPAKYSFDLNVANCGNATTPDFVVFSTGLTGAVNQANIVAFDNLYSGCTGNVPSIYWAYNTGTEKILTSPVISLDGSQIAFVETDGAGAAALVLLKWAASTTETIGSPGTPAAVPPASYRACAAPCKTVITLKDGTGTATDDVTSSVFYNYKTDQAWVADSRSWLHEFRNIFNGNPTEFRTAPWPIQVNAGSTNYATSPVYDRLTGKIYLADQTGFVYAVNATTGNVIQSGQMDFGTGFVESPVVDSGNGLVFVFSSSDGTANCAAGTVACTAVYRLRAGFVVGTVGNKTTAGNSKAVGTNPNSMYLGAFDSAYYNSANATGNLYVCGNTGANPTLYTIPINAGGVPPAATAVTAVTAGASTAACSPVTDIPNPNVAGGSEERLFLSPQNNGRPTACAGGGCLVNLIDAPWQASTAYAVGQEILSNRIHIETAIVAGTSGTTAPVWTVTAGTTVGDGGVTWLDQGHLTAGALAVWATNHAYLLHNRIIDSNGNVEIVTTAGTSGGAPPVWATTAGANTMDGGVGGVTWINAGILPTAALSTTGGTTGVIMDNVVGSGTLPGASQVYFGTLGNQLCPTSGGTGGCAMQASQTALQ